MSGFLVLRWVSLLVDVSVKSLLLLAATGVCLLLLRRASAASRHLVWLLAIGSLLALPLLSAALPGWHVRAWPHLLPTSLKPTENAQRTPIEHEAGEERSDGGRAPGKTRSSGEMRAKNSGKITLMSAEGSPVKIRISPRSSSVFSPVHFVSLCLRVHFVRSPRPPVPPSPRRSLPATILLVWLAGVGAVLAQVGAGMAQVRGMGRRCRRVSEGPVFDLLRDLSREIGLRRPVTLRMADGDGPPLVPMTWGWARPVVLLPADVGDWPERRLRSVLLHELAHVQRGDWLAQLLTYATCALYWCHPMVWLAARQMRLESERACDDQVLTAGVQGAEYASHLLEIVRSLRGVQRPLRAALTVAPQSPIERRLRSILEERRSRRAAPRWAVPLALAIAAGTVIPLAGVRPTGVPLPTPRAARSLASLSLAEQNNQTRRALPGSLVAILETTGRSTALNRLRPGRIRSSGRVRAERVMGIGPRPPHERPAVPRPRNRVRIPMRLLAALPPADPSLATGKLSPPPAPQPAPEPQPEPRQPAPGPAPVSVVPADFIQTAGDTEDADEAGAPPVLALVDERPDAGTGAPPVESARPAPLAAIATPAMDGSEAVPAPGEPEQDTDVLPATGQDRDVLPAATRREEPSEESGLRWVGTFGAAARDGVKPDLVAREILLWDPEAGEWVRLLLVWDRALTNGAPAGEDREETPELDPAIDLSEPGAVAEELPLWERVFDRWEKALADRRREREQPCPPVAPSAL